MDAPLLHLFVLRRSQAHLVVQLHWRFITLRHSLTAAVMAMEKSPELFLSLLVWYIKIKWRSQVYTQGAKLYIKICHSWIVHKCVFKELSYFPFFVFFSFFLHCSVFCCSFFFCERRKGLGRCSIVINCNRVFVIDHDHILKGECIGFCFNM